MNISVETRDSMEIWTLRGKFDSVGAREFGAHLQERLNPDTLGLVVDMTAVDYLSSAGLRGLLLAHQTLQRREGALALVNVQSYCRQVMDMTGFSRAFTLFDTLGEALAFCHQAVQEKAALDGWEELETVQTPQGVFRFIPGDPRPAAVQVLGHVRDVLSAQITPAHVRSRRFSETEYSLGLGGLGDRLDDYFPIMGEMITIGGTMVWLPTDGHDTPDFLIPQTDTGAVTVRTAFNASIAGGFSELAMFESSQPEGTTMTELYQALFQAAKQRRSDFRGVLALALRAQMAAVLGSGVKRSPIREYAPANGELITHPSNFDEWFDADTTPRHTDVTALICGVGVDLTSDLGGLDREVLDSLFWLHPANVGTQTALLHNHAVVFSKLPMPERAANLEKEIAQVVQQGDFIDMRHLFDASTVTRALIGIGYVQALEPDPAGAGAAQ